MLLAAACAEGVANLYLRLKTTPEQLLMLERSSFVDKWVVVPTLFLDGYSLTRDGELFQDLKRLQTRRNAIAHLKEEVTTAEGSVHQSPPPAAAGDEHRFVRRCRTLTVRLMKHIVNFDDSSEAHMILVTLAAKPGLR